MENLNILEELGEVPIIEDVVEDVEDVMEDSETVNGINIDGIVSKLRELLLVKTGQGSISEYAENPLNFDGKESTSRILRGLSGLVGSLDLALIDIIVGFYLKSKENVKTPTGAFGGDGIERH